MTDNDDADPLLVALADAAHDRDLADSAVRRLLAYAREYVPGSKDKYPLRTLAPAAGRSESWTGGAYGDDERNTVAQIVAALRPVTAGTMDSELAAMNAITTMPAKPREEMLATATKIREKFPKLSDEAAQRIQGWALHRYPASK